MVRCLMNGEPFGCSLEAGRFSFSNIQRGYMGDTCFVPLDHFVEKCVRVGPRRPLMSFSFVFPTCVGALE